MTCCLSDFSEKLPVKTGVKNSYRVKIILRKVGRGRGVRDRGDEKIMEKQNLNI